MEENKQRKDWVYYLKNLDRRIIFLIIALSIIVAMIYPPQLPIVPEKAVKTCYDYIDSLPSGSRVFLSFDYDPSTLPECQPIAEAVIRQCFSRNLKVYAIALWPQGASQAAIAFSKLAPEYGKTYGVDYVNLGYKVGGAIVIQGMGEENGILTTFPNDLANKPIKDMEIMKDVKSIRDMNFIFSISAGDPGIKTYVLIAGPQFGRKVGGGCTAVTAPEMFSFVASGQLTGLVAGLKGAADYEFLVGHPDSATKKMPQQSVAHVVIIIFIIIANIVYFVEKYREKRGLV